MDERDSALDGDAREENHDCSDQGKQEARNREQLPLLAAYCDSTLSVEAAEQLAGMVEDASIPTHAGEDLPKADREALLRKARQVQKVP
jgi:hypothetical protein